MKKLLLPLCLALAGFTVSAEFKSLKLTAISGEATVVSAEQLELTVVDGNLVVTNADGEKSFPVTDFVSMEFSDDDPSAAIDLVNAGENAGVAVYGIDGRSYGWFGGVDDARATLPAGLYVAHTTDGSTTKIAVRK